MTHQEVAPDRAHKRRSEERCRLDRCTRQLLHTTEAFGFYVRLFYLEEDDSFFLDWRLPDLSTGSKSYVNVEECFFSLQYCVGEIASHCSRHDCAGAVVRAVSPNPCALARRKPVIGPRSRLA